MTPLSFLHVALISLVRNRMRSFLTTLGIVIGVSAVITMVAVGNGAKDQIETQIKGMGTNLLMVMPGQVTQGGIRQYGGVTNFSDRDIEALRRGAPSIALISPQVRTTAQVVAGNQNWSTQVLGVSPDFFPIRNWVVENGRCFTSQEVKETAPVCLLGQVVAQNLFWDQDPVGELVQIKHVPFRVIGVLESKGSSGGPGGDQDDAVLLPYTTVMRRITGTIYFNSFMLSAVSSGSIEQAKEEVTQVLRESHRLASWQADDFSIRTQDEVQKMAAQTTGVLILLLGSVAGISLLVGGIGVMNIMLVSVTERTREIGIRRAIGASQKDIMMQFLIEALVLSFSGGIFGIIFGVLGAVLFSLIMHWGVSIAVGSILLAFGFSAMVGIFFGYYPAKKASQMDPIEALRYQ